MIGPIGFIGLIDPIGPIIVLIRLIIGPILFLFNSAAGFKPAKKARVKLQSVKFDDPYRLIL